MDVKLLSDAIDWKALEEYALSTRRKQKTPSGVKTSEPRPDDTGDGPYVVQRLEFDDGVIWLARLQPQTNAHLTQGLLNEVYASEIVRSRSNIPVPRVVAYEANSTNAVGVPFMILEYVPGTTAMDSLGGHSAHQGKTPNQFKNEYNSSMAKIQIGSIVKDSDGNYSVGPLPVIGGPFNSAAEFFEAWANHARFPLNEDTIRERTPKKFIDGLLKSIKSFPSELASFSQRYLFKDGPFPIFHYDLLKHHVVVDPEYNIQAVIGWGDTIVAPWELVEFVKDLTVVPPVMDGPLYHEDESDKEMKEDWKEYIKVIRDLEHDRKMDDKLSSTLEDWKVQSLAQAYWLYNRDGRIGFYTDVLKLFE